MSVHFDRYYIDRRDTEIRGLNVPRRIVRVLHETDAFDVVSFRHERRDGSYGRTVRKPFAEFHERYVIILPKGAASRSSSPTSTENQ